MMQDLKDLLIMNAVILGKKVCFQATHTVALLSAGSPITFNGDEFENIELKKEAQRARKKSADAASIYGGGGDSLRNLNEPRGSDGDILRELVKNKELIKGQRKDLLQKISSVDSEMSDASTLLSGSEPGDLDGRRRSRINHHQIRGAVSDTETDTAVRIPIPARAKTSAKFQILHFPKSEISV